MAGGNSSDYNGSLPAQANAGETDPESVRVSGAGANNGSISATLPGTNTNAANGGTGFASTGNAGGGGGGGGGIGAVLKDATAPQTNAAVIFGGNGGSGGSSLTGTGSGGGGGGGGIGLVVDGGVTLTNTSTIQGGFGGSGGASVQGSGGNSGTGGAGLFLYGSGTVDVTNRGTLRGGASGNTGVTGWAAARGGSGGNAVLSNQANATITLRNETGGVVFGGDGGNGSNGSNNTVGGTASPGGEGGSGGTAVLLNGGTITVENAGSITGGKGGKGGNAHSGTGNGTSGGAAAAGGQALDLTGTTITITNKAGGSLKGGAGGLGGNGADGGALSGTGGNGGSGGNSIRVEGTTVTIVNEAGAEILGGTGGNGGNAGSAGTLGNTGGSSSTGGKAIIFHASTPDASLSIVNRGTIRAGDAGTAGTSTDGSSQQAITSSSDAILGSSMTITNSGTISAGLNSKGQRGNAILFSDGANKLILESGSVIEGGIKLLPSANSTADLELAGNADWHISDASFQGTYSIFRSLKKSGTSTWTINGAVQNGSGRMKTVTLDGGTLAINGSYTQSANGAMVVQVTPTTAGKMTTTGAVSLAGTLDVVYAPGVYTTKTYTLIDANSVTGTFGTVTHTGNGGFDPDTLSYELRYGASNVTLSVVGESVSPKNDTVFTGAQATVFQGSRAAQAATFGRMSGIGAGSAGVAGGTAGTPGGQSGDQTSQSQTNQTQATTHLSGNLSGSGLSRRVSSDAFGLSETADSSGEAAVMASLVELFETTPQTNGLYGVWGKGIGRTASIDGTGAMPGFASRTLGGLVGIDGPVNDRLTVGLAGGYTYSLTEESGGSEVKTYSPRAMVYGSYALADPKDGTALLRDTVVDFSVGYGWHRIDSERKIAATGETAVGKNTAHELNAGAQLRRQITLPDLGVDGVSGLILTPRVGVGYTRLMEGDFVEHGTLANNLSVHERNSNSIRPVVGLGLGGVLDIAGTTVHSTLDVAYTHEVASKTPSRFDIGGGSFSQSGTTPSRGELTVGTGFGVDLTDSLSATVSYEAILPTGNTIAHTVETGLRYRF